LCCDVILFVLYAVMLKFLFVLCTLLLKFLIVLLVYIKVSNFTFWASNKINPALFAVCA
jgi:hypothetical protein